jgi:hypothetical protein
VRVSEGAILIAHHMTTVFYPMLIFPLNGTNSQSLYLLRGTTVQAKRRKCFVARIAMERRSVLFYVLIFRLSK